MPLYYSVELTISLPEELIEYADRRAKELNTSRSQVICQILSTVRASETKDMAVEGNRYYSGEHLTSHMSLYIQWRKHGVSLASYNTFLVKISPHPGVARTQNYGPACVHRQAIASEGYG